MRPSRPPPRRIPNEVGVVVGDPQVVDPLPLPGVQHVLDRDPRPVPADESIADGQLVDRHPALAIDPERVFGCRPVSDEQSSPSETLFVTTRARVRARITLPLGLTAKKDCPESY